MDYNKFKYEKKKKTKEAQKKQREAMIDIKEFRLSVTIDKHDFDTRVNNAKKAAQNKETPEDEGAGQIPFGPFLAVAAPIMYLWGDALKELYLKLVVGE